MNDEVLWALAQLPPALDIRHYSNPQRKHELGAIELWYENYYVTLRWADDVSILVGHFATDGDTPSIGRCLPDDAFVKEVAELVA